MAMVTVAKVAVENTTYQFDKAFDYLCAAASVKTGKRRLQGNGSFWLFQQLSARCDTCVGTDRG